MTLVAGGEEFSLIEEGKPLPIRAQPGLESHAAALAAYLKQMSGRNFEVARLEGEKMPEGPAIVLKVADSAAPRLGGDSFSIRTQDRRLFLVGETPLAVGFAVFAFLEETLGCRWWSFDEEEVPRNETLDRSVRAPFRQATLFNLKSRSVSTEQFTALTDYAILPGPFFKVEVSADGAAWTPVDLAAAAAADSRKGPLRVPVPVPAKRLRVSLPASGAVVEDTCLSGAVEKIELLWDDEAGVLTTEVTTATDENGLWPEREIKVAATGGNRP